MPEEVKTMIADLAKLAQGNEKAQVLLTGIKLGMQMGKDDDKEDGKDEQK